MVGIVLVFIAEVEGEGRPAGTAVALLAPDAPGADHHVPVAGAIGLAVEAGMDRHQRAVLAGEGQGHGGKAPRIAVQHEGTGQRMVVAGQPGTGKMQDALEPRRGRCVVRGQEGGVVGRRCQGFAATQKGCREMVLSHDAPVLPAVP